MAEIVSYPRYAITMDVTQTPPTPVSFQRERRVIYEEYPNLPVQVSMEDISGSQFAAECFEAATARMAEQFAALNLRLGEERDAWAQERTALKAEIAALKALLPQGVSP